jgi:membrane protease YdiL (CAAX protease family)
VALAVGLGFLWAGAARWLLPPQRRQEVPWGLAETVYAALLSLFWPVVIHGFLQETGLLSRASPLVALLAPPLLAVPFELASVLWVLHQVSGTLPYQLGLSTHRWQQNVLAGVLGWLILTPLTYAILLVAAVVFGGNDEHVISRLAHGPLSMADRIVIVVATVVAAPIREEFLLRGVVLFWASRRNWRSLLVLAAALAFALAAAVAPRGESVGSGQGWYQERAESEETFEGKLQEPDEKNPEYRLLMEREDRTVVTRLDTGPEPADPFLKPFAGRRVKVVGKLIEDKGNSAHSEIWIGRLEVLGRSWLEKLAPALFVLLVLPGYWLVRWAPLGLGDVDAARAIYATALCWAMLHSAVWPSPVPLFFLGLGLGWLAYRTQNLLGPVVLHGLFNATACVQILWGFV